MNSKQKPIAEWTLGEIKEECSRHKETCDDCIAYTGSCCGCFFKRYIGDEPNDWDFSVVSSFTEDEVEIAKAVKTIWTDATEIVGGEKFASIKSHGVAWGIPATLFPSIPAGHSVKLSEIVGEGTYIGTPKSEESAESTKNGCLGGLSPPPEPSGRMCG